MNDPVIPTSTNDNGNAPRTDMRATGAVTHQNDGRDNQPEAESVEVPAASTPAPSIPVPGKKRMKRSTRRGLAIVALVAVVAALGLGGTYFSYTRNYVSTDNAQVDGDKIVIVAPTTGALIRWQGQQGSQVTKNQAIGRVNMGMTGTRPQMIIRSPGTGTIALNYAVEGQWVTAGAQLVTAYDPDKIYVTARVDETDIDGVRLGAPVDISVDAYSSARITGIVTDIQVGAAGEFALFPETTAPATFKRSPKSSRCASPLPTPTANISCPA